MVKIFTLNEHGKIELTEKELKELLDDAYWDGYRAHSVIWTSPGSPYFTTDKIEITCGEQIGARGYYGKV